ncbi:TPA: AraC family transcriptional regulator [Enterobacter hormaechei subsp. steigerwaltii]|uniref:reactive chlorine-specific transcriptional regulator RclR n=1 Tax=Enterobacter hormaechei TaxID=158836 RepID=UPI000F840197|nr:reactive chlorine-specific transcriptional regulator RclR [Enterobacter hormaechei]HAV1394264.1 AraC family transcriptional regulator [Enterobacter hormaechei subsp. steigerwaltii]RTO30636.1 AraC family transcriptional regulator [Enterobacter hormaechei]HAV1476376.1 AraC family transcriptional regulator [Enterobacter hormaechei subsp. steigerwaltii]HAV1481393.1 AraC family transcriptional regulator [Enterobacter hormaechei subsp. steigerwaltii]HAV1694278.1 AraC family transcriptional regula
MDAFGRLLMLNDPRGWIDKNCFLEKDWKLPHAAGMLSIIRWHVVIQGSAMLNMPDGSSWSVGPGTVLLLPQNSAHSLCQLGGGHTNIVCGSLQLNTSFRHFLTTLPEVLFLTPRKNSPTYQWLHAMVQLLQQESSLNLRGAEAICSQQCATLLILATREWLNQVNPAKNVLKLLLHHRLGTVIHHMLNSPAHPWTVESLARQANMSRAGFARLFREISDSTPLAVLTTIRLQIAAQQLSRESVPVVVVAEAVGYSSESSFHKAFTRQFGCSPGHYRKRVNILKT